MARPLPLLPLTLLPLPLLPRTLLPLTWLSLLACFVAGCASALVPPQVVESAGPNAAVVLARTTRLRDQLERLRSEEPDPQSAKAVERYLHRIEKFRFDCKRLYHRLLEYSPGDRAPYVYGRVVKVDEEHQSVLVMPDFTTGEMQEESSFIIFCPTEGYLGMARLEWFENGKPRLFLYRMPGWARPIQEGDLVESRRRPPRKCPPSNPSGRLRQAHRRLDELAGILFHCRRFVDPHSQVSLVRRR